MDFTKLLSTNLDSVEKPKPVPVGTYTAIILAYEMGESTQKKTPYVQFNLRLLSPQSDVDPQAFAEFGGTEKLANKAMNMKFFLTDDAMFRLKDFLSAGLGINIIGRTIAESLTEATNVSLNVHIAHELSTKTPGEVFANVDDYSREGA